VPIPNPSIQPGPGKKDRKGGFDCILEIEVGRRKTGVSRFRRQALRVYLLLYGVSEKKSSLVIEI
jgi:hypothetical protein